MRIGIDFDGTVVDSTEAKLRYAREHFGVELRPEDSMPLGGERMIGRDAYEQMVRDVFGTAIALDMQPMPGAEEALSCLAADHEVYIVTGRYEHEVAFAHDWLEARGLQVDGIGHTSRGPKLELARALALEVFFEDSPEELAHLEALPLRAVLLETPYNALEVRSEDWHLVPDWPAFEALCARWRDT